jgi:hypothetical protein
MVEALSLFTVLAVLVTLASAVKRVFNTNSVLDNTMGLMERTGKSTRERVQLTRKHKQREIKQRC